MMHRRCQIYGSRTHKKGTHMWSHVYGYTIHLCFSVCHDTLDISFVEKVFCYESNQIVLDFVVEPFVSCCQILACDVLQRCCAFGIQTETSVCT